MSRHESLPLGQRWVASSHQESFKKLKRFGVIGVDTFLVLGTRIVGFRTTAVCSIIYISCIVSWTMFPYESFIVTVTGETGSDRFISF